MAFVPNGRRKGMSWMRWKRFLNLREISLVLPSGTIKPAAHGCRCSGGSRQQSPGSRAGGVGHFGSGSRSAMVLFP
jgi:hypothetical protein